MLPTLPANPQPPNHQHERKAASHQQKSGAVTSAGPGQADYVHYFLITHPDGDLEYQVVIELEDQRIAWSFSTFGGMVSDFVKRGTINANGKPF